MNNLTSTAVPNIKTLSSLLAPFAKADTRRALLQLGISLTLYLAGWAAMVLSLRISYALTLLLALPTAGFLVRLFIFFHDCGHNSFFPSTRWNRTIGFLLGVLVFTPSEDWWHAHAIHHATSGNLDRRGVGDVTTLTVEEYNRLSPLGKFGYRLFRHPLVMFGLGPIWMFLIRHRYPASTSGKKEIPSVIWANIAIVLIAASVSMLIGFWNYVLIQLPVIWLAGAAGIWLFYVQHQFPNVYWARTPQWDYASSAFLGASYYRLPAVFQWFSGNIGFHHIHHLNPRVPNYRLQAAYDYAAIFQQSPTLDIRQSLACVKLALYDEKAAKMVGFNEV